MTEDGNHVTTERVETERDRAWSAPGDMHDGKFSVDVFEKHIRAAVEAEREACAELAYGNERHANRWLRSIIAKAIRARGKG